MPSPLIHSAAGYLIFRLLKKKYSFIGNQIFTIPLLAITLVFSLLPDLDVIPGILFRDMERFHNNVSHSLVVGLLVAIIFSLVASRFNKSSTKPMFAAAFISYEFHILLDYFTYGRGVMLIWPFTSARFSSPVKLFTGVQWGYGLASFWHLSTVFLEGLTILFVFIFIKLVQKFKLKAPKTYF
jgi:inner membrane protein